MKVTQVILLATTAVLTFLLGLYLFSSLHGLLAAALIVFSPLMRAYSAVIQYEILVAFLTTATLLLFVLTLRNQDRLARPMFLALLIAASGALALTREIFVLLLPLIAWALLFDRGAARSARIFQASLYLIGSFVPIFCWIAWQYYVFGELVPISSKGPINLQIGNNPLASGTFNVTLQGVAEPSGWMFMRAHPFEALELSVRKLGYLFGFLKDGWNVPRFWTPLLFNGFYGLIPYEICQFLSRAGISLLAIAGALFCLRGSGSRSRITLLGAVGIVCLVHMVFIGSARFLIPVLPVVYLYASVAVIWLLSMLVNRLRIPRLALCAMLVVWLGGAFMGAPSGRILIEAEATDGNQAENVVCAECSGTQARYAERRAGSDIISLVTDEFYPAGTIRFAAKVRVGSNSISGKLVALEAYDWKRRRVKSQSFTSVSFPNGGRFQEIQLELSSDSPQALAFAVRTYGHEALSVDSIAISWGD